jgi:hypothetical protein
MVKYKKIPRYYEHCGLMDHEYMEYSTRESKENELQFGFWMKAEETMWHPGTPGLRVVCQVREGIGSGHGGEPSMVGEGVVMELV